jgi:hypothetical protein
MQSSLVQRALQRSLCRSGFDSAPCPTAHGSRSDQVQGLDSSSKDKWSEGFQLAASGVFRNSTDVYHALAQNANTSAIGVSYLCQNIETGDCIVSVGLLRIGSERNFDVAQNHNGVSLCSS